MNSGSTFSLIWIELVLGFGIPLAFGFWQLRSVKRERELTRLRKEQEARDNARGSAQESSPQ
jgi:uncharacterized protein HemX